MLTISSLVPGQVYTNKDIQDAFGCSQQGGMRRAHSTNTLVIFALHNKPLYDDKWDEDILHYTGMGQEGDQSINFAQNRTLADSDTNGVTVHLFEGYTDKEYVYDGIVKLAGKPYYANELDSKYKTRKVVKFPIKIDSGIKVTPSDDMLAKCIEKKKKEIKKLSDAVVETVAKTSGNKNPKQTTTNTTTYDRNELISENAKRRAKGICDLCGNNAPFNNKKKEPYLECHHVIRLADGGPDTIYNTVALCPNCHRKIHVLNDNKDKKKLINKVGEYVNSLGDSNISKEYKTLFNL